MTSAPNLVFAEKPSRHAMECRFKGHVALATIEDKVSYQHSQDARNANEVYQLHIEHNDHGLPLQKLANSAHHFNSNVTLRIFCIDQLPAHSSAEPSMGSELPKLAVEKAFELGRKVPSNFSEPFGTKKKVVGAKAQRDRKNGKQISQSHFEPSPTHESAEV